jgi:uncharacterized protein YbbC (DUF1343 family)
MIWIEDAADDLAGVVSRAADGVVLLCGEHGIRGDEGPSAPKPSRFDTYRRLETRSLYEYRNVLSPEAIADVDLLVVGLHEIGCRHYSYKRTMCHLLQTAAHIGKPVVVVDTPNPIRGDIVEGNLPDPGFYDGGPDGSATYSWFVAPICYRHGMTIGELALMARGFLGLEVDLQIITMEGWNRSMWWDDTGWPYLPMDPSIYSVETALGFVCTGLLQGTTLSWGIGTSDPFRVVGAPWIQDDRLLCALRDRELDGVTWSRAHFTPRWHEGVLWSRFVDQPCNGVRLHFTDRDVVRASEVQLSLMVELRRLYPDHFDFVDENRQFDIRLEDSQWSRRLREGEDVEPILREWQAAADRFQEDRRPYLLYT